MAKGQTEGVCGKHLRFTPSVSLTLDSSLPLLAFGHFPLTGGIGPPEGGGKRFFPK